MTTEERESIVFTVPQLIANDNEPAFKNNVEAISKIMGSELSNEDGFLGQK